MRKLLPIFLFLLIPFCIRAQSVQDLIFLGDRAMEDRDPYGALIHYENAMVQDSTRSELQFRYAEALRINHFYQKAAYYYYKVYFKDQAKVYPSGLFHLATLQKMLGNYQEARKSFRRLKEKNAHDPEGYYYRKAIQEMKSCDIAIQLAEDELPVTISPVSKVNTEDSEFGGRMDGNNNFFFSSLRGTYGPDKSVEGIYKTRIYKKAPGGEERIEVLDLLTDPANHIANGTFSSDGTRFYFSLCQTTDSCEIWMCEYKDSVFVNPVRVEELNPPGTSNTQPFVLETNDGEVIYFASNREGGKGGYDIWSSKWTNGKFEIPHNLGSPINTPDHEISPFYDGQEEKLFFSSTWHYGLGGFDIFSSRKDGNTWEMPENIGSPFNSSYNDHYYFVSHETDQGFFSSNRGGLDNPSGFCCNDIYSFDIPREEDLLPEITTLEELNDYLPVTLYFHNDEPDPKTTADSTSKEYLETYYQYLNLQHIYEEEYGKGMGSAGAENASLTMAGFFSDKIDKGVADLKLFTALLHQELEEGQHIEITIKGFASPLAATEYNVRLTSRRIASLINYFYKYEGGVLKPFLNGSHPEGSLRIQRVPFGDYRADKMVSDNPNESDAIYSISAAQERKIEITSVSRVSKDEERLKVQFDKLNHDFGRKHPGVYETTFTLNNEGNVSITLDSLISSCPCLTFDFSGEEIFPGATGKIKVTLDATELSGNQYHSVSLLLGEEVREISVTIEVIQQGEDE